MIPFSVFLLFVISWLHMHIVTIVATPSRDYRRDTPYPLILTKSLALLFQLSVEWTGCIVSVCE